MCNLMGFGGCCGLQELVARTKTTVPFSIPALSVLEIGIWDVLRLRSPTPLTVDAGVTTVVDAISPSFRGWMKQLSANSCPGTLVFQERSTGADTWHVITAFDVPPTAVDVAVPFDLVVSSRFVRAFISNADDARAMSLLVSMVCGAEA